MSPIPLPANVMEDPGLRDAAPVFTDRRHAGEALGAMLKYLSLSRPIVLAIPAGGVPVGAEAARALGADLDLIFSRKLQVPGNTESGFGAIAGDGPVFLNDELVEALGLGERVIADAEARTRDELARRERLFRAGRPLPALSGREAILVDDGLASGITMTAAAAWARGQKPGRLIIAAPTGHLDTVLRLSRLCDLIVCPNLRAGYSFAVASAYEHWHDLDDAEVMAVLRENEAGKKI